MFKKLDYLTPLLNKIPLILIKKEYKILLQNIGILQKSLLINHLINDNIGLNQSTIIKDVIMKVLNFYPILKVCVSPLLNFLLTIKILFFECVVIYQLNNHHIKIFGPLLIQNLLSRLLKYKIVNTIIKILYNFSLSKVVCYKIKELLNDLLNTKFNQDPK